MIRRTSRRERRDRHRARTVERLQRLAAAPSPLEEADAPAVRDRLESMVYGNGGGREEPS
jgi:hypothetical protein